MQLCHGPQLQVKVPWHNIYFIYYYYYHSSHIWYLLMYIVQHPVYIVFTD